MFGWEFPPHITGGLGTACFGLSQSLAKLVSKITFVLPKVKAKANAGKVEVLGAGDIRIENTPAATPPEVSGPMSFPVQIEEVDSTLQPYQTAAEYRQYVRNIAGRPTLKTRTLEPVAPKDAPEVELTGGYGKNLLQEVYRYAELASRQVLKEAFDVIHAHDWMTFAAGVEAKRLSGLPLVVHVHATEFDRCGESIDQRIYDIERWGMEQADRIIAVSQRTKDMIVARYGIPGSKVVVVHNGVAPREGALEPRQHPKSEKVVVFLGRITQQKGPEYFLEAAYLVSKKLPTARFVMAGSGDMLPRIVDRMAELGIVDRFHFAGFVNQKQREELFSQADVFVLSSVSEPFGITPIEAMQHDVPVIVTKQSGVAEVVHAAIKVDFWDVRRMADAIINILTQEPLSTEMALDGRRDLRSLTWERAASRVSEVYKEFR